jgi:hypothetical protein
MIGDCDWRLSRSDSKDSLGKDSFPKEPFGLERDALGMIGKTGQIPAIPNHNHNP